AKPRHSGRRGAKRPVPVQRTDGSRSADGVAAAIEADFDGRPAIAVLPFTNASGSSDHAYFADGIADDIINELASWRTFPVIARSSTFAFRNQQISATRLGKELGARYLVDGSVTKLGLRVRISASLIDTFTGIQVAAERYDRTIDALVELQDEIAAMIVGAIAPEVLRAERHRIIRKPRKNGN